LLARRALIYCYFGMAKSKLRSPNFAALGD
jgi:hypothetical protein